jgi:hypothetical protein
MNKCFYKPTPSDGFEFLTSDHSDLVETVVAYDGVPPSAQWSTPRVEIVSREGRSDYRRSSFPTLVLSQGLAMRQETAEGLRDLLSGCVFLPLAAGPGHNIVMMFPRVIDALDPGASELEYFPDGQKIMYVRNAALRTAELCGVHAFRLPGRHGSVFVSQEFVDRSRELVYAGLDFDPQVMV